VRATESLSQGESSAKETGRIEAFSDGVFAMNRPGNCAPTCPRKALRKRIDEERVGSCGLPSTVDGHPTRRIGNVRNQGHQARRLRHFETQVIVHHVASRALNEGDRVASQS
jgi:hypothetical protein